MSLLSTDEFERLIQTHEPAGYGLLVRELHRLSKGLSLFSFGMSALELAHWIQPSEHQLVDISDMLADETEAVS